MIVPATVAVGGGSGSGGAAFRVGTSPALPRGFVALALSAQPELPREYIDTSAVPAITGATHTPADAAAFQTALNNAALGDVIVLTAGVTYTGNFTLPNKVSGSGWITIRSSAHASLPAIGTRVGPGNVANMPTIRTTNSFNALATETAAHHWWLLGLEITVVGVPSINAIVAFGGAQTTIEDTPHHLTVDRCYIHGQPTGDVYRCIQINSATTAIVDSYVSEGHVVGQDAQAIFGSNGPGPFKIVNNYISGSGENIMFGGADPYILNLVPSDIEFRLNHCFKPLSWDVDDPSYAGTPWSVKNLFELKNAERVWVDQNIFENNWVHAQTGTAILFTPRNQDGSAPWCRVRDVTFTRNIIRNSWSGFSVLGTDTNFTSQQTQRIRIAHNLLTGLGDNGIMVSISSTAFAIAFDHNTAFPGNAFIVASGDPMEQFVFTNNIMGYGAYGAAGTGQGSGNPTLGVYFPGCVFDSNLLVGAAADSAPYPAVTHTELDMDDVGFLDHAAGNYRLASSSVYYQAGLDGLDFGCDHDGLPAG